MANKLKIISLILVLTIITNVLMSLFIKNKVFAGIEQTISSEIDNIDEEKYPGIKDKIKALQEKYQNWSFKILYTGLDWDEVISNENVGHGLSPKNLIYNSSAYQGEWVCAICGDRAYDNGNWRCASEQAIRYLMDPRTSLNETLVFQFEELTNTGADVETLKTMTKDTFLEGHEEGIIEVSNNNNVNAYYIVARLIQEQGKSGTVLTKGQGYTEQYVGYYNAFNIAASGNTTAEILYNALAYAEKKGWDTLEKSIEGGISFLANNYINNGQNTLYLQKFDVEITSGLYSNQYMQNILASRSEGTTLKNTYSNINSIESAHTFIIPVYENMPKEDSPVPDSAIPNIADGDYVRVNVDTVLMIRDTPAGSNIIGYLYPNQIVARVEKAEDKENGTYWDKIQKADGTVGYSARETYEGEDYYKQYLIPINGEDIKTNIDKEENNTSTGNEELQSSAKVKVEQEKKVLVTTPDALAKDILEIYGGSVKITRADGSFLNGGEDLACTGFIVDDKYTVVKLGDSDGNGKVNSADALQILKYSVGNVKLEGNYLCAANVDKNEKINSADALQVLKYSVGNAKIEI